MTGPISNAEAQKLLGTRLEYYRLAVQAGFYNEWPETVAYRGFHIAPDSETDSFVITKNGARLINMKQLHVAKVWITCRLDNCGLVEAHAKVKAEEN